MIDPELVLAVNTFLLAVLLGLTIKNARRIHKMSTQVGTLGNLADDITAKLDALKTQLSNVAASIQNEITRVEAAIAELQNQNNPALDVVIGKLQAVSSGLTDAAATATTEQSTLDAERPVAPPA